MDWLTFIATIVSAFAWPLVIIVFLIILRNHIGGLAARIEELRFPGGAQAKFVKELDSVRKQSEKIPIATRFSRGNIRMQSGQFLSSDELKVLELANRSPEAVVMEGFREIEEVIDQNAKKLPAGVQRRNPLQLIDELSQRGFLDAEARALFMSLRNTRNTAAHSKPETRITPGEAIEYREHARFFAEILQKAIADYAEASKRE
jgi:hypothetical protein